MTFNMSFAGKTAMAEELARSPLNVENSRKQDFSATTTAQVDTAGSALTATRSAPMISGMTDSSADMLNMEEELAMLFGAKRNARKTTPHQAAKNGV